MEVIRKIGLVRSASLPITDSQPPANDYEIKRLKEAYLGRSFLQENVYAVLLSLKNDPSKRLFGSLKVDHSREFIDIPLEDHTPEERLRQQAYETTFFGKIDPDEYRTFATREFTRDSLLAFLNRSSAELSPRDMNNWLNTAFDLKLYDTFGPLYIGCYGGPDRNTATINNKFDIRTKMGSSIDIAIDFINTANKSIPQLSVNPLSIRDYLQEIQSKLKFLPKDW